MTRWLKKVERAVTQLKTDIKAVNSLICSSAAGGEGKYGRAKAKYSEVKSFYVQGEDRFYSTTEADALLPAGVAAAADWAIIEEAFAEVECLYIDMLAIYECVHEFQHLHEKTLRLVDNHGISTYKDELMISIESCLLLYSVEVKEKRMEAPALERCYAAQLAATAAINGYLQAMTVATEVTSTPNCSLVQSEDVNLAHNYDTDQAYLPRQGPVSVIWDGGANSKCASANFDKEYNLPTKSKFSVHLEQDVGVDGPAGGSGLEHLGDGGANDPPRNTGAAGVDTSALHLVRSAEIIVGGSGVNNSLLHSEDVDMPAGGNGYDEGAGVQLPNSVYMPADGSGYDEGAGVQLPSSVYMPADGSGYDEGAGVQLPSSIDMPAGGGDYDEGAGVQLPVSVNYAIVSGGDLGGGSGVTRGPAHVVVGGGDLGHGGSAAALEPVHADDDVWLSDPQAGGPDPGGGSTLNSNFVCPVPLVDVKGYGKPAVTLFDSGSNSTIMTKDFMVKAGLRSRRSGQTVHIPGSTLNSNFVCPVPLVDCNGQVHVARALVVDSICRNISSFPPHRAMEEFKIQPNELDHIVNKEVDLLVGLSSPKIFPVEIDRTENAYMYRSRFGKGIIVAGTKVISTVPVEESVPVDTVDVQPPNSVDDKPGNVRGFGHGAVVVQPLNSVVGGGGGVVPDPEHLADGVAGVEHCATDGVDGGDEVLPDIAGGGSGEMNSLLPGEDNKAVLYSDVVAHALPLDDVADHAIAGAVDGVVSGGGDLGHSGNDATLKPAFEPVHGGDVWDPVPQAGGLDPGGGDDVVE